jgi:hypothetical protein
MLVRNPKFDLFNYGTEFPNEKKTSSEVVANHPGNWTIKMVAWRRTGRLAYIRKNQDWEEMSRAKKCREMLFVNFKLRVRFQMLLCCFVFLLLKGVDVTSLSNVVQGYFGTNKNSLGTVS